MYLGWLCALHKQTHTIYLKTKMAKVSFSGFLRSALSDVDKLEDNEMVRRFYRLVQDFHEVKDNVVYKTSIGNSDTSCFCVSAEIAQWMRTSVGRITLKYVAPDKQEFSLTRYSAEHKIFEYKHGNAGYIVLFERQGSNRYVSSTNGASWFRRVSGDNWYGLMKIKEAEFLARLIISDSHCLIQRALIEMMNIIKSNLDENAEILLLQNIEKFSSEVVPKFLEYNAREVKARQENAQKQ